MTDYYEILGVDRDASLETIKSTYRKLIRIYHPDENNTKGGTEKFRQITEAYSALLSDPLRRAEYDKGGRREEEGDDPRDRKEIIATLENLLVYFEKKKELYEQLDVIRTVSLPYWFEYSRTWLLILAIMLTGVSAFCIWDSMTAYLSILNKEITTDTTGIEFLYLFAAVIVLRIGIYLLILYFVMMKTKKKRMAELTYEAAVIAENLQEYYADYGYCPIEIEYTYPDTIVKLMRIAQSGRAETIKEILSLYEQIYSPSSVIL